MTGVRDLTDADLVERVVRGVAARPYRNRPLWNRVAGVTGLGSTYAAELCRWFDLDPDAR